MKTRTDIVYANGENRAQWGISHIPVPGNVLFFFVCLFINVIYFVTAQWLSFQAVLSHLLSVLGVVLPKKVKSVFMTSSRAQGPVATILRLPIQR